MLVFAVYAVHHMHKVVIAEQYKIVKELFLVASDLFVNYIYRNQSTVREVYCVAPLNLADGFTIITASSYSDNITRTFTPAVHLLAKLSFRCATLYDSLTSKRSAGDVGVILVSGSFLCCRLSAASRRWK